MLYLPAYQHAANSRLQRGTAIWGAGVLTCLLLGVFAVLSENSQLQWILYPLPLSFLALSFVTLLAILSFRLGLSLTLDKNISLLLVGFYLPLLISGALLLLHIYLSPRTYMAGYLTGFGALGRMLNTTIYMIIFIYVWSLISKDSSFYKKFVTVYASMLFCLLGVAILQFAAFRTGLPFPNFGSVTQIHGVGEDVGAVFKNRLTSFVREPAFLASFIADLLILALVFMKGFSRVLVVLLCFFVLIFTYSISAVVQVAWLAGGVLFIRTALLFRTWSVQPWMLLFAIIGIPLAVIGGVLIIDQLLPYTDRIGRILSNPTRDVRILEVWAAVKGNYSGNWLTTLFGYGPGTYSLLTEVDFGLDGRIYHDTSNNQFADTLFEAGLLGVGALLIMMVLLFRRALSLAIANPSLWALPLFVVHLVGTGLFKAQIFNLRYHVMLLILLGALKLYEQRMATSPAALRPTLR